MTAIFSWGFFKKLKISNGYLIIGKEGKTVRLANIKSLSLTKEGLAINGEKGGLATIKGLRGNKAFAAMDFINAELDKIKPPSKNAKLLNGPRKLLLTVIIVIILAAIIVAAYALLQKT